MRILLLTQIVVYPADAGPKIKTLLVFRHLVGEHKVVYCTFVRTMKEQQNAEQLGKLCSRVSTVPLKRSRVGDIRFLLQSLATGDSFLLRRDDRPDMHGTIRQLLHDE